MLAAALPFLLAYFHPTPASLLKAANMILNRVPLCKAAVIPVKRAPNWPASPRQGQEWWTPLTLPPLSKYPYKKRGKEAAARVVAR